MFIRSNIPFMREKRLESFIDIECVAVRLKLSNSWTTFNNNNNNTIFIMRT